MAYTASCLNPTLALTIPITLNYLTSTFSSIKKNPKAAEMDDKSRLCIVLGPTFLLMFSHVGAAPNSKIVGSSSKEETLLPHYYCSVTTDDKATEQKQDKQKSVRAVCLLWQTRTNLSSSRQG